MNYQSITTLLLSSEYSRYFKKQQVKAKTSLLAEGEVATNVYFIKKGCLRLWFNNNGKDITFQFFFEGEIVASIESFMNDQASAFNLESIEDCELYSLSKSDFEKIIESSSKIKKKFEALIFQRLLFYQKLFLSRIKDKPEERYRELLEKYPALIARVPQHYIASYLGITSVSLSRIRNRK